MMEIRRGRYLKRLTERKGNGFVKVITGVKGCGKSYLLNNIFYDHLIGEGIDPSHIIRFAFDSSDDLVLIDESPLELEEEKRKVDPQKFTKYVSSKIKDGGTYYLLLDEVQNLGAFEAVLNDYLRKGNLDVYVTGSNSKFLSTDILTEFAGRGDEIHMLPLSFSEFASCYEGSVDEALDEYFVYGGLPAVASMKDETQKAQYLKAQMQNVYLRDIVDRHGLRNEDWLGELVDILASGTATLVNPAKLSNTFKSIKKAAVSDVTIAKYIGYLEDAFLIKKAKRYDVKGKKYISTPFKIYFEDVGLRNARLDFRQIEETHLMENIVFNELRFRGFNVDVGAVKQRTNIEGKADRKWLEVDFVANLGRKKYYVQSAYDLPDEEKMKQETYSLDRIGDSFKKVIVVNKTMKPRTTEKGYLLLSLKDFLLHEDSLDF